MAEHLNNSNLILVSVSFMRYAIKFAYDGTKFSGSQRQPNVKTVEGEMIDSLINHQVIDDVKTSNFQVASRTDAGVSALGNVVAFNTEFEKSDTLNILNSKPAYCWYYAIEQVDSEFNPRHANMRWYRYHLYNGNFSIENCIELKLDPGILKSITRPFLGTHDFKNFTKPNLDKTTRIIDSITITENGAWILIDIKAQSFLWNQVRRLINSWVSCARDRINDSELYQALNNPKIDCDFGLAPPEPLFLMDIEYNIKFKVNKQILKKMYDNLIRTWQGVKLKEKLFNYIIETI